MIDVILPGARRGRRAARRARSGCPAGFRPIVVDNGSTDGSGATSPGRSAPMVVHEPQRGFGAACAPGCAAARADVVCFMDCDGSLDPRRACRGSRARSARRRRPRARRAACRSRGAWPLHARVANRVLALELRRRGGSRARPTSARCAPRRREPLLALGIRDRRFGWPLEMVLRGGAAGWRDRRGRGRLSRRGSGARRSRAPLAAPRARSATWPRRCDDVARPLRDLL